MGQAVRFVDEQRMIEVETKLTHQEHLLAELNQALTSQQSQISNLERLCRTLAERIRLLSEAAPATEADEPPPHY